MTVRQEPERAFARVEGNPTAGHDFVVGDVHGEFPTLETLLSRVGFAPQHDRLFALGDLVDRGPRSVDALAWMESGRIAMSVRGNHEQMLLRRIELAETNPREPTWMMHPWFARDVARAVLTGHAIVDEVTKTGNVWHIDTGAGFRNGRLTLARIDIDPIETLTVGTAPRR